MKKRTAILLFSLLSSLSLFAQDYIYKADGEKIAVKIIGKDTEFVRYQLFGSRDINEYRIGVSQVFMIDYEDGTIENFKHDIKKTEIVPDENAVTESIPANRQYQQNIYKEPAPLPEQDYGYNEGTEELKSSSEESVLSRGRKSKENKLIDMNYDRSSLTLFALPNSNSRATSINNFLEVTEKYNDNDLGNKFLNVENTSEDITSDIKDELLKEEIAKKSIAKWFNRKANGAFDMNLVMNRAEYNATDADYHLAIASKRGFDALKDQGLSLINKSYIIVFDVKAPITMEQYYDKNRVKRKNRIRNGFIGDVSAYVYKIDFNEDIAHTFFNQLWINGGESDIQIRKQKFENFNFPVKFENSYFTVAQGVQYNSNHALGSKTQLSDEELLLKYADNAFESIMSKVEKENIDLRIKSPIVSTHPIKVPIGTKESVKYDQRFFVYENRQDRKGEVYSKHIGVIRAKGISGNSNVTSGDFSGSTFYQVAGKRLDEHGMFVEQNDDIGLSVSAGYMYKPVDYADESGILMRFSYYPKNVWPDLLGKRSGWFGEALFTSMYLYSDIIFHTENSERTSYSVGLGNDLNFARNYRFSPYLGYGFDQIYDSSVDYIEGGLLFGTNIKHNIQFMLHGKSIFYYDLALVNAILDYDIETLSLGLSASIQVSF